MEKKGSVVNSAVWHYGVKLLKESGLQGDKSAREVVGKWYANHKKEDVLAAIISAEKNQVTDPIMYIQKILSTKKTEEKVVEVEEEEPTIGGQWGVRAKNWKETRFWPIHFGPKPGEDGCQCPPELLRE